MNLPEQVPQNGPIVLPAQFTQNGPEVLPAQFTQNGPASVPAVIPQASNGDDDAQVMMPAVIMPQENGDANGDANGEGNGTWSIINLFMM